MPDSDAEDHGEKNPEGEKPIEKGEALHAALHSVHDNGAKGCYKIMTRERIFCVSVG